MRKLIFLCLSSVLLHFSSHGQCTGCPTIQMSGTALDCYGDLDGTASVQVNGGSGSYAYSWSNTPSGSTNGIVGLAAGTYTVAVTDNCTGCTVTGAYTVNAPNPIALSGVVSDVSCHLGTNGSIIMNLSGGTPGPAAYYDWDNDGVGDNDDPDDYTTASTGNYSVTYSDNNGCTASASFFVNEPPAALGLDHTKIEVDCFNTPTGSINISPYGGTQPYAFDWNNDAIINDWDDTEDLSGLYANSYEVVIRDFNGCTYNQTIPITQPAAALYAETSSVGLSCFGDSNGEVIVSTISGGTSPYNFGWASSTFVYSQNTSILQNLPADIYTVDVTDDNGCSISLGATVISPTPIVIISEVVTDVTCFGYLNGSINVGLDGGTVAAGYNYQWINYLGVMPGENGPLLAAQPAGDYTLIAEDDNGCQVSNLYTIQQPNIPLAILTNGITHVLCYGMNTGAVDITAVGGTPGYFYDWENSALVGMGSTQDISGLFEDTYSVIVTDANGCVASGNFVVDQPQDTLMASSIITPVVCFGESNGAVDINTSGGTLPYQYEWTNSTYQLSAVTEDLSDFPSEIYTVVITDGNGCIFNDTYFVSEPLLLDGNIIGVDILCNGDNTGSVDLSVTGGTTSYNYLWNNSVTSEDQNNLFAGTYSVTVTDANFCQFTDSITLTEPADSITYYFETHDVICFGEDNGSIELTATGGTPNYNYDWSSGDSTAVIQDLTAGWYTFTVTDANACTLSDSIEVTQPELLLANEVVTDVTCFGFSDGVIDISPSGGTAPYNYTWYNSTFALSSQDQDLIDFPYDIYQLQLRDSLGCLIEIFVELPEPELLVITAEQVDVTCAGGSDGSIDVSVTGGNPGYTYDWSNGEITEDITNIPVDEYTLIVTDTKSCLDSITIIIYEPDTIFIDFLTTEVSCADQFDGTALALPYGGTGEFTYLWEIGETSDLIEGQYGGTYAITVTDIVGCTAVDSVFITTNPVSCIVPPTAFTPNGDNYNDTWFLNNIEIYPEMEIKIFNRWGNLIYERANEYEEWTGIYHGQPLPSETYYYIINLNTNLDPLKGTITIVR